MSQSYPHPLAQIRDTLSYILSCGCLPNPRSPPSPTLSAQDGELDGLLFDARPDLGGGDQSGWHDDEMDDALSLRGVGRRGFRRTQPKGRKRDMLGGLFGRRSAPTPTAAALATAPPAPSTSALHPSAPKGPQRSITASSARSAQSAGSSGSAFGIGSGSDLDDDAASLGENTIAALPDLAKKWEPEVSLEDLAREEAEQAKREKDEGRERARRRMMEVDEEFGDFEDGERTPTGRPAALP